MTECCYIMALCFLSFGTLLLIIDILRRRHYGDGFLTIIDVADDMSPKDIRGASQYLAALAAYKEECEERK